MSVLRVGLHRSLTAEKKQVLLTMDQDATLSLRTIHLKLLPLAFDETIDSARLHQFESPFVQVVKGSALALISANVAELDEGDPVDVDLHLNEDDWIEIWSPAVHNIGKLSMRKKNEIYEYLGSQQHIPGIAQIDSDGYLILCSWLPCGSLSADYVAEFVAKWVSRIDEIDTYIAQKWDGLTRYDEGPSADQGSANHAEY